MDTVWFVASEETADRAAGRASHRVRQEPHAARDWVATTDQRNAELVAATVGRADRVIVNGPRMGPR